MNAVSPGTVETPMWDEIADRMSDIQDLSAQKIKDKWLEKIPLKRLATPDDITPLIMYLCCEEAGYITGQVIQVDGGLVM